MNEGDASPGAPDAFPDEVGFAGAVSLAWRLYRSSLPSLLGFFLLLAALGIAVNIAAEVAAAQVDSVELQFALLFFVPAVAYVTAGSVAVALAAPYFADRVAGRSPTLAEALRAARPSLRDILAAGLFASIIALSAIALLTPLVYFFLLPFFYGPPVVGQAVALEGRRLQPALRRARDLLRGSFLRVAGLLLAVSLGIGLVKASLLQFALPLPTPGRAVVTILSQAAAEALLVPFLAAASFIAYLDLRVRHEDLDLDELKAERAAARE